MFLDISKNYKNYKNIQLYVIFNIFFFQNELLQNLFLYFHDAQIILMSLKKICQYSIKMPICNMSFTTDPLSSQRIIFERVDPRRGGACVTK